MAVTGKHTQREYLFKYVFECVVMYSKLCTYIYNGIMLKAKRYILYMQTEENLKEDKIVKA